MKVLSIASSEVEDGIEISLRDRKYRIGYPADIWSGSPAELREALVENISFASTHFLGPMLKCEKICYDTRVPLLESYLFRNQFFDLLSCELADNARHLSYLRSFYNLEFEFASGDSVFPSRLPEFDEAEPAVVIPFTFGKESLCTFAMMLELGVKPVLVYCQEPVQPYEESYKLKALENLRQKTGVASYFIENAPGLFRYGQEFKDWRGIRLGTEIGWGSQTTLLAMMMLPFNFYHQADYILFGSEYSNNEFLLRKGWKTYLSYDQSSFWTMQQNNLIRILSNDQCRVKSSLEPLEELAIFYLLHTRYPELGQFQFSCSAEKPLLDGSQWCHQCHKCERMFVFACCCGIHPAALGFKKNILEEPGHFESFLGQEFKSGSQYEMEGIFTVLERAGIKSPYIDRFRAEKQTKCESFENYFDFFTGLKDHSNLPVEYESRFCEIFEESNRSLAQVLLHLGERKPDLQSWPE